MLAAWYERQGPAAEVLQVGEMAAPQPGPGEVQVRVNLSGVNPGDTKKRGDWVGYGMPYPRIVPHSYGSGVLDAVGEGVDSSRVGRRVWVYGAQSYRPFGTAAQLTAAPADQAVELPDEVSDELGACLGIPGITAHRAVFADGPVAANDAVIAAYATRHDRPEIPFWPMLFANLTIRLLGSDDFPAAAKHQAAADLTTAAREGALTIPIGDPLPLEQIAKAHDRVDAGARRRVLVKIPH